MANMNTLWIVVLGIVLAVFALVCSCAWLHYCRYRRKQAGDHENDGISINEVGPVSHKKGRAPTAGNSELRPRQILGSIELSGGGSERMHLPASSSAERLYDTLQGAGAGYFEAAARPSQRRLEDWLPAGYSAPMMKMAPGLGRATPTAASERAPVQVGPSGDWLPDGYEAPLHHVSGADRVYLKPGFEELSIGPSSLPVQVQRTKNRRSQRPAPLQLASGATLNSSPSSPVYLAPSSTRRRKSGPPESSMPGEWDESGPSSPVYLAPTICRAQYNNNKKDAAVADLLAALDGGVARGLGSTFNSDCKEGSSQHDSAQSNNSSGAVPFAVSQVPSLPLAGPASARLGRPRPAPLFRTPLKASDQRSNSVGSTDTVWGEYPGSMATLRSLKDAPGYVMAPAFDTPAGTPTSTVTLDFPVQRPTAASPDDEVLGNSLGGSTLPGLLRLARGSGSSASTPRSSYDHLLNASWGSSGPKTNRAGGRTSDGYDMIRSSYDSVDSSTSPCPARNSLTQPGPFNFTKEAVVAGSDERATTSKHASVTSTMLRCSRDKTPKYVEPTPISQLTESVYQIARMPDEGSVRYMARGSTDYQHSNVLDEDVVGSDVISSGSAVRLQLDDNPNDVEGSQPPQVQWIVQSAHGYHSNAVADERSEPFESVSNRTNPRPISEIYSAVAVSGPYPRDIMR